MMTKVDASKPVQANLFKVMLRDIVFDRHELVLTGRTSAAGSSSSTSLRRTRR